MKLTRCPGCKCPTHASESNDDGVCRDCMKKQELLNTFLDDNDSDDWSDITDDEIRKLWSTTTDPQISANCRLALGIGSPIWAGRAAALRAVADELNGRARKAG